MGVFFMNGILAMTYSHIANATLISSDISISTDYILTKEIFSKTHFK